MSVLSDNIPPEMRNVKGRVTLSIDDLVGKRRWVLRDGKLVEVYGPPREGDVTVVKSACS